MSRELNPEIFGSSSSSRTDRSVPNSQSHGPAARTQNPSSQLGLDAADAQILSAQLEGLKDRVKDLIHRSQKQDAIIEELVSGSQLKFSRFKEAFHRVEDFVKNNMNDLNGRFGQLNSRIVSKNLGDTKLEQMLEKHNEIVLAFESKLNQLQKTLSNQEMQLMNYKSALQNAQAEIARLKRL